MKAFVLDSGILINFSMNGLLYVLEELKKNFDGKFLITKQVKYETVDRPIGILKFELGALRIKDLIDKKILEFPEAKDSPIYQEYTFEINRRISAFLKALLTNSRYSRPSFSPIKIPPS